MFTVTFTSLETSITERATGVWTSEKQATKFAKLMAASFPNVVVWSGQPGGMRVLTLAGRVDRLERKAA